jgi:hypothetical protein
MQVLFVGGNTNTFLEYFDRLWSRYGRCTPADISQNMSSMSAAWNPATEDWAKVVNQIQNGAIMSYYCEQPLQEHQLLHIAETIILGTGVLGQQYSEWRSKPAAKRTWDNLVTFMTEKYNLWLEVSASAAEHGYGGNIEGEEASQEAYADSLRSFGQVNADNASTFNNLSGTNATLLNQLAPAIQQMQAQLQGLALAVRSQPQQQPAPPVQQYRVRLLPNSIRHHPILSNLPTLDNIKLIRPTVAVVAGATLAVEDVVEAVAAEVVDKGTSNSSSILEDSNNSVE